MKSFLPRCEEMLRTIGLEGPIYLLDAEDVASQLDIGHAWAMTSSVLWADLRPAIEDWQGPGFTAIFSRNDERPVQLLSWALHELAHHLPDMGLLSRVQSSSPTFAEELIAEQATKPGEPARVVDWSPPVPWFRHDPEFARLACHLWFRAAKAGWDIEGDWIYPASWYRLPALKDFYIALEGEPKRLADVPLADLHKIATTAEFLRFSQESLATAKRNI